ncbi:MAG: hypothetical protein LBE12_12995 [Planctomycetaceae bacterium]|nr:hypothetical protein [Planctomycetaceae bacterium]
MFILVDLKFENPITSGLTYEVKENTVFDIIVKKTDKVIVFLDNTSARSSASEIGARKCVFIVIRRANFACT